MCLCVGACAGGQPILHSATPRPPSLEQPCPSPVPLVRGLEGENLHVEFQQDMSFATPESSDVWTEVMLKGFASTQRGT